MDGGASSGDAEGIESGVEAAGDSGCIKRAGGRYEEVEDCTSVSGSVGCARRLA